MKLKVYVPKFSPVVFGKGRHLSKKYFFISLKQAVDVSFLHFSDCIHS